MRIRVDKENDALYFRLDESRIVESEEIQPGIILDYDENKRESWDLDPDVEMVYKSSIAQPSYTLMCGASSSSHEAYTYDPTNGTFSAGDIWRVRQ